MEDVALAIQACVGWELLYNILSNSNILNITLLVAGSAVLAQRSQLFLYYY